jgi:hypothetical protein
MEQLFTQIEELYKGATNNIFHFLIEINLQLIVEGYLQS